MRPNSIPRDSQGFTIRIQAYTREIPRRFVDRYTERQYCFTHGGASPPVEVLLYTRAGEEYLGIFS